MKKHHVVACISFFVVLVLICLAAFTSFSEEAKIWLIIFAIAFLILAGISFNYEPKKELDFDVFFLTVVVDNSKKNLDGAVFVPEDDTIDFMNGAKYIPTEVTDARRKGQQVIFHQKLGMQNWYWEMPDGKNIPY